MGEIARLLEYEHSKLSMDVQSYFEVNQIVRLIKLYIASVGLQSKMALHR